MRFRLLWPIVLLTGGVVFCCLGILCIGAYVVEAVRATAGLPDRSPLFWYLPVLFMGFFLFAVGLIAVIWAILRLRKIRRERLIR